MEELAVDLDAVSKSYGGVEALRDLTLKLPVGVSYSLIGRNGAGKTTALRLILGMLRPSAGSVRVFGGDPIADAERVKVHVGYLAEDQTFPAMLRPADLFGFFASCYPTWDPSFAESLIERFRIPVRRRLAALSKGQQRQAALLCAVAHRPRLLVLDEPGGGLDPVVRREFLEEVIDLLAAERTAVLFSSHHLGEVERLATRIGILHHGRLILEEDLDRLRERSSEALVSSAALDGLQAEDLKEKIPGLIGARRRGGEWVLTLLAAPAEAGERLRAALGPGAAVRQSRPLPLEDLFIALVGADP